MIEKLKELDNLQTRLLKDSEDLKERKKAFEAEIESDVTNLKALEKEIAELKLEIEPFALRESQELGKKTLESGIVIKTTKSLSYDKDKALDFAKEKGLWLNLDKKSFEATAKTMLKELDWVTEETTDKVTFPKKLKLED